MVRVRLFANLRDLAGTSHLDIEGETIGAVVAALGARYGPDFERHMETARFWKNGDEGAESDLLADGDELAVIPPVSGGTSIGMTERGGLEGLLLAVLGLVLIGANAIGADFLVAMWVGVAALWVIDIAVASSDGEFEMDFQPPLAAILVSVATSNTLGLTGLGVSVGLSMVLVMGWAIVRPRDRDLTTIAASALCTLMVSLSVSSVLLARSVIGDGDRKVAGLLIIAAVGTLVGRLAERSHSRVLDPYLMALVAMVGAAVVVAYLSDFEVLAWFFIGLILAGAMIAGRGVGSAFRSGRIELTVRPEGVLTPLDGPMMAAAVFMPLLSLIL